MDEPETISFKTKDHPEANDRQAESGDFQWTFSFPLEDGRILQVLTGREGRDNLRNIIMQEDADDAAQIYRAAQPSNYQDFAMPLSGDPEKDRERAEAFIRHDRLISEGLCPNGHGAMVQEDNTQTCTTCGFVHHKFSIRAEDAV